MSDLVKRLWAAYELVKLWPEKEPDGFMNLIALRNLAPLAADMINDLEKELKAVVAREAEAHKRQSARIEALEAEVARLKDCLWRADWLALAAQKLIDAEKKHAGLTGIQQKELAGNLRLYWKVTGGPPALRAALAGKGEA